MASGTPSEGDMHVKKRVKRVHQKRKSERESDNVTVYYITTNASEQQNGHVTVPAKTTTLAQLKATISKDLKVLDEFCGGRMNVELFALEGFPLVGDSTAESHTLADAGIAAGELFVKVLVGMKEEQEWKPSAADLSATNADEGDVQIFVKHVKSRTIPVTPAVDTVRTLMIKIEKKIGLPVSSQNLTFTGKPLHSKANLDRTLDFFGIAKESTLYLTPKWKKQRAPAGRQKLFYAPTALPSTSQSSAGICQFYASLYSITSHLPLAKQRKLLAFLRSHTGDASLVLALRMLFDNRTPSNSLRKALVTGLYTLFRSIVPQDNTEGAARMPVGTSGDDHSIFEHSALCWMQLLDKSKDVDAKEEEAKWSDTTLTCPIEYAVLEDPVRTPPWWSHMPATVLSRKSAIREINKAREVAKTAPPSPPEAGEEQEQEMTAECLEDAPLHRALLAAFPSKPECLLWTPTSWKEDCQLPRFFAFAMSEGEADHATKSADIGVVSLADYRRLEEKRDQHPFLRVHPPLSLKSKPKAPVMTIDPDSGFVSVMVNRSKGDPANSCRLFRVQSGREVTFDIDQMVSSVATQSAALVGMVTRPPHEVIVVLLDTSGSMGLPGFECQAQLLPGRSEGDVRVGDRVQMKEAHSASYFSGASAAALSQLTATVKRVTAGEAHCKFDYGMSTEVELAHLRVVANGYRGLTRLETVKQLFHAYANRSMAYNLPHVVGLTLFGSEVRVACPLTEAYETFKEQVDSAGKDGTTSLFDALASASKQLSTFTEQCDMLPAMGCLKRIICLTDGNDTSSSTKAHDIARQLQSEHVVVDSIMIGGGLEDMTLRAISGATGGCSFNPSDITTALRLFEMETVLSLRERVQVARNEHPAIHRKSDLDALKPGRNDEGEPGFNLQPPRNTPQNLAKKATGINSTLQRAAMRPPREGAPASRRVKRLLREIQGYSKNQHPAVEVWPCEEDVSFWNVLLQGPSDTPYAGGVFVLWAKFPEDYPRTAPEVRFRTPIHHCNINNTGKVCHSIFDHNWASDMSMRQVFDCLYGLLLAPEPDDPLDSVLASQFYEDRAAYDQAARAMTATHASKPLEMCREQLTGGSMVSGSSAKEATEGFEKVDHPKHLVCPLTLELFEDPVSTIHGHSYERKAIERHLAAKAFDPLTRAPLTSQQIFPNISLRHAVEEYRKAVTAASPWWQT